MRTTSVPRDGDSLQLEASSADRKGAIFFGSPAEKGTEFFPNGSVWEGDSHHFSALKPTQPGMIHRPPRRGRSFFGEDFPGRGQYSIGSIRRRSEGDGLFLVARRERDGVHSERLRLGRGRSSFREGLPGKGTVFNWKRSAWVGRGRSFLVARRERDGVHSEKLPPGRGQSFPD